ncbi:MAG: hypothetical protein R6U32_06075 [Candidatus Woesearchaeota archaeon]
METRQRQTAFKVKISEILNGKYVVQEGWEPNYVTIHGNSVSRVNIIGAVVSKGGGDEGDGTLMLDDGTGRIPARSFDSSPSLSEVNVGDMVLVIGKPREYSNEMYLVPEIIKVLEDKRWAELRKVELERRQWAGTEENTAEDHPEGEGRQEKKSGPDSTGISQKAGTSGEMEAHKGPEEGFAEEAIEDKPVPSAQENGKTSHGATDSDEGIQSGREESDEDAGEKTPAEMMIECIKNLDDGDGVDTDEVIKQYSEQYSGDEGEELINKLLERGEIFELRPGRVKTL